MKTQLIKSILAFCIMHIAFSTYSNAQTSTALDDYILDQMKDYHIPGFAFSLIKDGKITLTKGYGYANIEKDIPFTPNTINAEIASISKTVTATAVMKLWEQNFFELDDPINNYLPFTVVNPYFPNNAITFRMLLSHTSSLVEDNDGAEWVYELTLFGNPGTSESLASFTQNMYTPGGAHYRNGANFSNYLPGSHYAYSNWGYSLLGYLVEHISGIPFDQYCNINIFQPLCMNHTGWYFSDVDTNIVSRPYVYDNGNLKQNDYGLYEYPDYPDGQIKSTVVDLSRFLLMNMNYGILDGTRILDSTTVAIMRTIEVVVFDDQINFKSAQGLGWLYIKNYGINKEYWGHGGSDLGITTEMWNNISDGTGLIMFSNSEHNLLRSFFGLLDNTVNALSTSSLPILNCSYISTPCEHSTNYWKNNSSQWALNAIPMKIGTKHFYTKNQTLDALDLPVNGDASIVLAKALIAAKLNMAQGSELSPIILTIHDAMNLMGTKRLPFNIPIPFTSPTGIQMLALAAILDSYNSGAMNTTACSGSSLRETGETIIGTSPDAILSVFPNPFSSSTIISFSLSQSQNVSLKIFDVNGRLVSIISDKIFEEGEHQIEFNAEKLNAGIYFLKMQAGDLLKTEKLVVTK